MSRKSHSNQQPNKPPRSQDEIQKDFQQHAYQAGVAQYQAEVFLTEVRALNDKLKELNREAAARNLLDKKDGKVAPTTVALPAEEPTNEQA